MQWGNFHPSRETRDWGYKLVAEENTPSNIIMNNEGVEK